MKKLPSLKPSLKRVRKLKSSCLRRKESPERGAGAGHDVDRHAQLLEHLDHADVSRPTCTAAAQHERDTRA
jgi:hypothetical protein